MDKLGARLITIFGLDPNDFIKLYRRVCFAQLFNIYKRFFLPKETPTYIPIAKFNDLFDGKPFYTAMILGLLLNHLKKVEGDEHTALRHKIIEIY